MNPLHPSVRDLERVFPRLARRVNPHRAFVRELERGSPQQQFRTHPLHVVSPPNVLFHKTGPPVTAERRMKTTSVGPMCQPQNFEVGIVREKEVHVVAP